jgi:hypothetical protein
MAALCIEPPKILAEYSVKNLIVTSINSLWMAIRLLSVSCVIAVRLTRKLADMIDGVDLSASRVGQVLHLPWRDAWLLIAEGWAEMIERRRQPRHYTVHRAS